MLLAIDIGNSSINIGIFEGDFFYGHRIAVYPLLSSPEYREFIDGILRERGLDKPPEGAIISSVVPGHTEAVKAAVRELTGREPLIAGPDEAKGLSFDLKAPSELGADRVAAAVGAVKLFGAPVAILDFGTATTVSFIGGGNVYRGGAILPGLRLMARALSTGTAKLPEVDVETALIRGATPLPPVGRDTEGSILSGIVLGTAGAVERIIAEAEVVMAERYKVVATGGSLDIVLPNIARVDNVEPLLTLKGLRFIYEANRR